MAKNDFPTEAGERTRTRIARAVLTLTARHDGRPPTYREIGRECGITSTGMLAYHLNKLRESGVLEWEPKCPRTLKVLMAGTKREAA